MSDLPDAPVHGKKRFPQRILLIAFLVSFILFIIFTITGLEKVISWKISRALSKSETCSVQLYSRPPFKIWYGEIDYLHLHAVDSKDFALPLKDLTVTARDIKVDVFRMAPHDLSYVRTLHLEGIAIIDQSSLAEYLSRKLPPPYSLEVKIVDGTIELTVSVSLIRTFTFTVRGNLHVEDNTRLYLKIPEISFKDLTVKREYLDAVLKAINPVVDLEEIDFAGRLLGKIPEEERKKWSISVETLELKERLMVLHFSAIKREQ